MGGAVLLCPLYAFMTLTGTNLRLIACLQVNTRLQAGTERKQGVNLEIILELHVITLRQK